MTPKLMPGRKFTEPLVAALLCVVALVQLAQAQAPPGAGSGDTPKSKGILPLLPGGQAGGGGLFGGDAQHIQFSASFTVKRRRAGE